MTESTGVMKRWMLDAIVGVGSLIVFLILILLLPAVLPDEIGYLGALLLFVLTISAGGYAIRGVST
jgi:hypothetical protein